ncbi:hypothetical protein NOMA109596_19095 [Nocardioides marinus]
MRGLLEHHDDLADAAVHPLAGAQVERHARPAPVLHLGLEGHEGLGVGAVRAEVVGVRRGALTLDQAGDVLPADGVAVDVGGGERLERLQDLELLVADVLPADVRRGLHRHEAQQLQQVVLHHVAQRAGVVVVAAAGPDTHGLGHRDLHVVDPLGVPQRLEEGVGEARDQEVLHALLAQVVVDPEDLVLGEDRADGVVDLAGGAEVVTDRLLHDDAGPLVDHADLGEPLACGTEEPGGDGEVEDPDRIVLAGAVLEQAVQQVPALGRVGVQAQVVQATEQALDGLGLEQRGLHEPLQGRAHLGAVALVVDLGAGDTDDAGVLGQVPLEVAVVERGQQLAQREVAGAAEDGEVADRRHGRGDVPHRVVGGRGREVHASTVAGLLDRYKHSFASFRQKSVVHSRS